MTKKTTSQYCKKPDRDAPKLKCGYPLPCPHHAIVIDASGESTVLHVPLHVPYPSRAVIQRMLDIGAAIRKTTHWTPEELQSMREQKERDDANAYVHCKVCSSVVTFDNRTHVGTCSCKSGPTL